MTTFKTPSTKIDTVPLQEPVHKVKPEIYDPKVGTFIPTEESVSETSMHKDNEIEYEDDPEYKKDKTISSIFVGIAAIALLGAGFMYLNQQETVVRNSTIVNEVIEQSFKDSTSTVDADIGNTDKTKSLIEQYKTKIIEMSGNTSQVPVEIISAETVVRSDLFAGNSSIIISSSSVASTTTTQKTNRNQKLTEMLSSETLGISFLKDPYWKELVRPNGLILRNVGPDSESVITLIRFKGTSVTTEDPEKGSVTYYYDLVEKSWMSIEIPPSFKGGDTVTPLSYIPIRYTKSGLPLFLGTSTYKTYIVALSISDFVIVNINGNGNMDIIDEFIREIKKI